MSQLSSQSPAQPRVWLVTGCSSGIGRHLILAILAQGDRAIATARDVQAINDLAAKGATTLQLDVDVSPTQIAVKLEEAVSIHGRVDVLVNNAGYAQLGTMEDIPHESLVAQFQTNVFGPLNLARAILPHFRRQKSGTLVVMSSIGYLHHMPGAGAYSASKAALDSLFGTLSDELQGTPIRTWIFQPGNYRTDIVAPRKVAAAVPTTSPYEAVMTGFLQQMNDMHGKQPGDTTRLAKLVVKIASTGEWEGQPVPSRIVLGSDAFALGTAVHEQSLKEIREWEGLAKWADAEE